MKKWKKMVIAALTVTAFSVQNVYALNPNWYQDTDGWHYYKDNNTQVSSDWMQSEGKWYYFNAKGVMQTGWITLQSGKYYCNSNGAMATGWQQIDGIWYYFNQDGTLAVNAVTPDAYITGEKGERLTGYRVIAGVVVQKPPAFVSCNTTQMENWQGITAILSSVGNGIYNKTNGARRFHLYKDQVSWCSLEGTKEEELLSLKKVPETGGYQIVIRTALNQNNKDETTGAAYDYQILRLFCYSISGAADQLNRAIYGSFAGKNNYGILRDTWVEIGDTQVLYKALNGAGCYEIRQIKGE